MARGGAWTPEEDGVLERLWGTVPMEVVALALGRTASACTSRWHEMSKPRHVSRRRQAWTEEEDAKLAACLKQDMAWTEVSRRIPGRSPKSCAYRARYLRIVREERRSRREAAQTEALSKRRCHDCGRPTVDYRCPKCLAAWRRRNGVSPSAGEDEESYASFGGMGNFD